MSRSGKPAYQGESIIGTLTALLFMFAVWFVCASITAAITVWWGTAVLHWVGINP